MAINISEAELIRSLRAERINPNNKFDLLKALCILANKSQQVHVPIVQELVLRALDKRKSFEPYGAIVDGLARQLGLFPYMDAKALGMRDALAREFHRPSNASDLQTNLDTDEGLIFHRAQSDVFRKLLDGKSIILSAPTSFGKSSIVDALIESLRFNNVVIVVPTIALIDETRRRLSKFRNTHKIITHASQDLQDRNVFVFTQERVVDYPKFPELDLFVLDEFYKLNPSVDQEPAATLNHAFYKLTKASKQFYLLGPNIQNVPDGFPERFSCEFIRTDYATVVTELERVRPAKNQEIPALLELCGRLKEPTLIFCASPMKARKVALALLEEGASNYGNGMPEAAQWVGENYHPDWTFSRALENGIGIHHGRMPRALAQFVVRGFNEGKLKLLICTSTLIEGVNTKAKNVVIFDNKIAQKKYDYFTFNNIRGRSGRMFHHFVGKVFLFHQEPEQELPFVDIPVYSQDAKNTPESLLIQLSEADLIDASQRRMEPYKSQSILNIGVMRENIGIEPRQQLLLATHLRQNQGLIQKLAWSSYPTYEQLEDVCLLVWEYFVESNQRQGGVSSGKQLAFRLNQLRSTTIVDLIAAQVNKADSADDAVEEVLDFVRQWPQFRFPRLAMGLCRIQASLAEEYRLPKSDYTFFISQVENLFSDPSLMALDEYGIPFPLAKKLEYHLASEGKLDGALLRLKRLDLRKVSLSPFEISLISDSRKFI